MSESLVGACRRHRLYSSREFAQAGLRLMLRNGKRDGKLIVFKCPLRAEGETEPHWHVGRDPRYDRRRRRR